MTSILQQNCHIIEPLAEKTWGRGWVVLVVIQNGGTFYSFYKEEIGERLAKTQHEQQEVQLHGRYLIFGEYLQNLLPPKLSDKHALSKVNLTSMKVSMFQLVFKLGIQLFWMNNKTIIEFSFRIIWGVMEISDGGRPRRKTPSEISIILQMILSLIQ